MKKLSSLVKGYGLSILFLLLGFYILKTTTSLFGKIVGISCIVFFAGLMIWSIIKMIKKPKSE